MRKLSFRCQGPDGVVKLSKEAPEQLEERVIGIGIWPVFAVISLKLKEQS